MGLVPNYLVDGPMVNFSEDSFNLKRNWRLQIVDVSEEIRLPQESPTVGVELAPDPSSGREHVLRVDRLSVKLLLLRPDLLPCHTTKPKFKSDFSTVAVEAVLKTGTKQKERKKAEKRMQTKQLALEFMVKKRDE